MIRLTAELTPAGTSYLATGQGQPVVLIHGVGLNKEMWGGQVVGLATKYRVIAYDMLGHGASPRPESGTPCSAMPTSCWSCSITCKCLRRR